MKCIYGLVTALVLMLSSVGYVHSAGVERLDYESCRLLVEEKEILSIAELSERVHQLRLGRMIDMMLLKVADKYIYEMEIAESDGEIRLFYINARNGRLIKTEDALLNRAPEEDLFEQLFPGYRR
ncbi:PepSY domain-containing protein [Amphritea sp. HPY]|uniref:PepSY domain-containing protein n=1 Tax=Amphritea sp. HPY TaxID=3421652 RepID=UPI003D7E4872